MTKGLIKGMPQAASDAADWWLARRVLGTLSARDEAAFQVWLSDPANAEAYAAASRLFDDIGGLAAESEFLHLRKEALTVAPEVRSNRMRVAASIGLMVIAGAAVFGVVATGSDYAPGRSEASLAATKRYETRLGERRKVSLDDGSVVSMNTDTIVEVVFSKHRRDIRLLRGEALFEVAHNTAWPFVVTAGDRHVVAVGTAFNVRLNGDDVRVVLVEGKVRVEPLQPKGIERVLPQLAAEQLVAGEQLTATTGVSDVKVETADVKRSISWQEGQVVFRDDALSVAVAEFNRYSDVRLMITDPKVADLRVSGVFRVDRPQNFVAAVTGFYPVEARRTSAGTTELVWRDSGSIEK
ncbi:FecR domain-containing protein [Asticcacaulis sp. BYS171W]|uniref:FecR domain-containing protein n=1 Tax=Asticcacaulis aquaticus TaxID=2984212 RepID=A0ABT5HW19_9CAUL|nr:FecR domain-containing protein [Asticcacaulis aquaticus]MDC7684254.1 FecR domain-containing protein [Asticcacaulis aquaticus]